jgi:hypothetical protein
MEVLDLDWGAGKTGRGEKERIHRESGHFVVSFLNKFQLLND